MVFQGPFVRDCRVFSSASVGSASAGCIPLISINVRPKPAAMELHTTVMPFILGGVSILGITSANCPMERRRKVWGSLVIDLKSRHLDAIVAATVTFDELPGVFEKVLSARHRGRYVEGLR